MNRKIKSYLCIFLSVILMFAFAGCSNDVSVNASLEPSDIYVEAMNDIQSGKVLDGLNKLCDIPDYEDSEVYLLGYTEAEYFIGEWKDQFENSNNKLSDDITVKSMNIKVTNDSFRIGPSDSGKENHYIAYLPMTLEYVLEKSGKEETYSSELEGLVYFSTVEESTDNRLCFDDKEGKIYYNLLNISDTYSLCQMSIYKTSFENRDFENFGRFTVKRTTEKSESGLIWTHGSETETTSPLYESEPDDSTTQYSNGNNAAVQKAISYLRVSAFSYEGLIGQLEYEGFSHTDAVFGVDNCGADWNEQALLKANSYLMSSAFSYRGLVKQLEYEKFTSDQAAYGVGNCGANWKEQAAKKAQSYLSIMSMSRSELISQLEYEGFTHEEAVYGADFVY